MKRIKIWVFTYLLKKRDSSQSMNVDHWQRWLFKEVVWFQFRGLWGEFTSYYYNYNNNTFLLLIFHETLG